MQSSTNPAAGGGDGPTLDELRKQAAELDIQGRSTMDRDELVAAIDAAKRDVQIQPPAAPAQAAADVENTSGRPDLADVARERVESRNPRVLKTPTPEN